MTRTHDEPVASMARKWSGSGPFRAAGATRAHEGDTASTARELQAAAAGDCTCAGRRQARVDCRGDDGKIRLRVEACGTDFAATRVIAGGALSERKGVNVPDVLLPISALTEKDRRDLDFGLTLGVDWVALSFVQRPEDMQELRDIVQGRAGVMAKLEKPAAIESLAAVVALCDAVMVARGDLGWNCPPSRCRASRSASCANAGAPASR
jgi:pyruvate kinase